MRFHMGVSFSLRKLKKFIIPILIGLLTYFGINVFTGFTQVHAGTNLNTYYYINYEELPDPSTIQLGSHTFQDVLDLINNNNTWDFIPIISYSSSGDITYQIDLYAFPKNTASFDLVVYGYNAGTSTRSFYLKNSNSVIINKFVHIFDSNLNYSSTNDSNFTNLQYAINNNVCSTGCSQTTSNIGYSTGYESYLLNDNQSYPFFDTIYRIIYSSPFPLTLVQGSTSSNNFYKTLLVDETALSFGDNFITYSEWNNTEPPIEWGSNNVRKLDDLFISNIPKANLSSYKLTYEFNYDNLDYIDSMNTQFFYYGRIDHGSYYSYESINCFNPYSASYNNYDNLYTGVIQNISCSSDLTNYDQIFIRMRQVSFAKIHNYKFTYNYGYVNYSPVFNGGNSYDIMDYFDSLPSNFNILFSTNVESQNITFSSNQNSTLMSKVSRSDNSISSLAYNESKFGIYDSTNVMIYNYLPQYDGNTDLSVFIQANTIVSYSTTNSFTYYDESNTITSDSIINNYQVSFSSYDIDNIFDKINNFINDLENDMFSLHEFIQEIYDSLPSFIQLCLIVLYSLSLTYLLFKVIRK